MLPQPKANTFYRQRLITHIRLCFNRMWLLSVWPLPLSLATTRGISVDFFSSPYLDVSVREVPHAHLCIQCTLRDSSSRGFPHSEIHGYIAYLQLPVAYRSLSRPSSAPDAKAFTLRSFSLELSLMNLANSSLLFFELLEFLLNKF